MSEKEFLNLYKIRLEELMFEYMKKLKDDSNTDYVDLIENSIFYKSDFSYKANLLISELLIENEYNPNQPVLQDFTLVALASNLLLKTFSIQQEIKRDFDKLIQSFLEEVHQSQDEL